MYRILNRLLRVWLLSAWDRDGDTMKSTSFLIAICQFASKKEQGRRQTSLPSHINGVWHGPWFWFLAGMAVVWYHAAEPGAWRRGSLSSCFRGIPALAITWQRTWPFQLTRLINQHQPTVKNDLHEYTIIESIYYDINCSIFIWLKYIEINTWTATKSMFKGKGCPR